MTSCKHVALVLVCTVVLSACTSIQVSGFVTDEVTGEPVSGCGVSFRHSYANTDAAGHFLVRGRKSWAEMTLVAAGYERKTVPVDASDTRYPVIHVQMTPKRRVEPTQPSEPPGPEGSRKPAHPHVEHQAQ